MSMGANPKRIVGGHTFFFRTAASPESRASPKKADERGAYLWLNFLDTE